MNAEKQPDVSVILPVYNVEKYIRRCLDSLVNQDCSCNYEIIIINDGTKDNSMEMTDRRTAQRKLSASLSKAMTLSVPFHRRTQAFPPHETEALPRRRESILRL